MDVIREINETTSKLIGLVQKLENKYEINLNGKKIIIDAGHGGDDPGAIGPTGLREADSTLIITHLVAQKLRDLGATVVLTRATNNFIKLSNRVETTRKHRDADCFISIHHNSVSNPDVSGIETFHYYNSTTGSELAKDIQDALMGYFPEHNNRGVKEAGFYVIKHTPMTAVLTELEFISNPKCEKELQNPEDIAKYVTALTEGIVNYLRR